MVIRSLGGTAAPRPRADAGTIVGNAAAARVVLRLRILRRVGAFSRTHLQWLFP
jgi:hypothetical protein